MLNNLYQSFENFLGSLGFIGIIVLSFLPFTILISFLIWTYNINKNVHEIHDMFSELVKEKRAKAREKEKNKEQPEKTSE